MVPAGTSQYEPGSPAWRRKGLMLMRTENTIDYRLLEDGELTLPLKPSASASTVPQ